MPGLTLNGGTTSYHHGMVLPCSLPQNGKMPRPFTSSPMHLVHSLFFNGAWIRGDWQPHQQLPGRSIQWQELFDIIAAVLTWVHHLSGLRIQFHCDNLSIVQAWVNQSSKQPGINELLRLLFLTAAQYSFTVSLVHLPGWLNCIADALSRNFMPRFFSLAPQAHLSPTPFPPRLAEL